MDLAAPQKGGPTPEFINIQPPQRGQPLEFINQRGSASRFHQPKGGPPLDFINQKWDPLGVKSLAAIFQIIFLIPDQSAGMSMGAQ